MWWNSDGKLLKHDCYKWEENYFRNREMGETQRNKSIIYGIMEL